MSVQPAAPPATRVMQLLVAGKTTQQTADLTGWPRNRVMAVITNTPGWLHDPEKDTIYQPGNPGMVPQLPEGTEPATVKAPLIAATRSRHQDSVSDLLVDAADIDDKAVQREHRKTLEAIARLREAVSTVSERIEAEKALAEAEQQLAAARARVKELGVRRRTSTSPAATTGSEPTPQQIRAWAAEHGIDCPAKGKVPGHVHQQYQAQNGA